MNTNDQTCTAEHAAGNKYSVVKSMICTEAHVRTVFVKTACIRIVSIGHIQFNYSWNEGDALSA